MDRLKQCCESQNPKPSHLQEFSLSYSRRKGLNNLSIYLSTNPPLSFSSFFIPPFPLSSVPFSLSLSTSHFPLFLSLLFFLSFPIAFQFFPLTFPSSFLFSSLSLRCSPSLFIPSLSLSLTPSLSIYPFYFPSSPLLHVYIC